MFKLESESRPYSWDELTEAEKNEARSRGFESGPAIRYISWVSANNGGYLLSRWVKVD